jgi:hypothetical protein
VNATGGATWLERNQRHLSAAVSEVRAALERHAARPRPEPPVEAAAPEPPVEAADPPALEVVAERFGLSPFERSVLVLCAGMELSAGMGEACAAAQGDASRCYPTFGLALAALDGAHWSAVTPAGPLRRWRLIEVVSQPVTPLVASPLRIDERVLHHLAGLEQLDERLVGLVEGVPRPSGSLPCYRALARRMVAAWDGAGGAAPLVHLWGGDGAGRREVATLACAGAGRRLCAVAAEAVPMAAAERETFTVLWEREAALASNALLVEADAIDPGDPRAAALARWLEQVNGLWILSTRDRWPAPRRPSLTIAVGKPPAEEQHALWTALLGDAAATLNGQVETLAAQFDLGAGAIRASVSQALGSRAEGAALADELWEAGRAQGRTRLDELARRVEPAATWDDLVLPEPTRALLHELTAQVAHRAHVHRAWGFAARGGRGLGIAALFSGPSGTGKTMAAEVLAHALRLDLYTIDLSCVVSKYIGETEKNLRRIFDAAEDGGAILFFDEADALFGKRSEVKDSHDRYANIEVNYLLQRMESYRGLAVLATNRKGDLDPAFLRRVRFVVHFPFPDAALRAELWRRAFPPGTPTAGLDVSLLARLDLPGGNIRNIALNAAFLAANSEGVVRMDHLLRAARTEYAKLEKPLSASEIGGWS